MTEYTHETAKAEAKKYDTYGEFYQNSREAYIYCWKNKILGEACKHVEDKNFERMLKSIGQKK